MTVVELISLTVAVATFVVDVAILVLLMRWKKHDIARDTKE